MANMKISSLTPATVPLVGTELFEIVQGGVSKNVEATDIANTFDAVLAVPNGGTGVATLTGYVKGNGASDMTAAATVPLGDVSGLYYGAFLDTSDQAAVINTPTAVLFNTTYLSNGISVVSGSRITFANAGFYNTSLSLQFVNTSGADVSVEIWQRINGVDGAFTGSKIVVPKSADGGVTIFSFTIIGQFTAGQYLEVMWATPSSAVTIDFTPAKTSPYNAPAIPSSIFIANRIA